MCQVITLLPCYNNKQSVAFFSLLNLHRGSLVAIMEINYKSTKVECHEFQQLLIFFSRFLLPWDLKIIQDNLKCAISSVPIKLKKNFLSAFYNPDYSFLCKDLIMEQLLGEEVVTMISIQCHIKLQ